MNSIFGGSKCILCNLASGFEFIRRINKPRSFKLYLSRIVLKYIIENIDDFNPPKANVEIHKMLKKESGINDPFMKDKDEQITFSSKIISYLGINPYDDSIQNLKHLLALAAYGNGLDPLVLGYNLNYKMLEDDVKNLKIALNDMDRFINALESGKYRYILYLLDNAGEALFDLLLSENLRVRGINILFAVKPPHETDITLNDFARIGGDLSRVFELKEYPIFISRNSLPDVDLIISKGLLNFEAYILNMNSFKIDVLTILKAKCSVIADYFKIPLGSYIIRLYQPIN
ncbi:MAG: ARMT1-like domain-containing protein [Candidatus Methanomethylicia archaeon]